MEGWQKEKGRKKGRREESKDGWNDMVNSPETLLGLIPVICSVSLHRFAPLRSHSSGFCLVSVERCASEQQPTLRASAVQLMFGLSR